MQRPGLRLPSVTASGILHLASDYCARGGVALKRLRPDAMVRIRAGAEVVLTLLLAAVLARLVWTVLQPPAWAAADVGAAAPARRAATPVVLLETDPFHRASAVTAAASAARAPETMLNLQLFGVRASADEGRGSAIVATPDNVQGVFHVGQEIMPGVRLEQVLRDRIVIRRNGVPESLSFARDPADAAPAASVVAAATPAQPLATDDPLRRIDVSARDFALLLRFTPHTGDGVRGLRIEGSADPSLLQQAGLAPGDVLLAVNGTPVTDTAALAALAAAGAARLSLEFERNGQRKFHRLAIDREQ